MNFSQWMLYSLTGSRNNADHYLLNYLAENKLPLEDKNNLIVNDSFGALTIALSDYTGDAYGDSFVSGNLDYFFLYGFMHWCTRLITRTKPNEFSIFQI